MKNEQVYESLKKYAAMLAADGYIECGYIAAKADGGLYITTPDAEFADLAEEQIAFVTDKNVEELEGNFRAAAVLLICALKSKGEDGAAAIVDSKSILEFSSKKVTLPPILEDSAQINGVSVRAAKQNTAAEVVNAISGARNACFLPDAGAVVTGRTLAEVYTCTLVLDKACNGYLLAEKKGGAQHLNAFEAWLEHMVYKLKYSKKNQSSQKAAEEGKEVDTAEKPSAIDTDELKAVAQEIKDAGVKLLEENLVQGTWGNIAVRLNDKEMMATPSALDYVMLKPEQMAIVDMESMEWRGSNKPTSEKGVHAAILKMHPESKVTVHTHPFYGSILAAMRQPLAVPEKYRAVLGDSVPVSKFAPSGTPWLVKNVAAAIGDACACIIASHGIVVRGKDMNEAFEICRALEDACRDYLTDGAAKEEETAAEDGTSSAAEEQKTAD